MMANRVSGVGGAFRFRYDRGCIYENYSVLNFDSFQMRSPILRGC